MLWSRSTRLTCSSCRLVGGVAARQCVRRCGQMVASRRAGTARPAWGCACLSIPSSVAIRHASASGGRAAAREIMGRMPALAAAFAGTRVFDMDRAAKVFAGQLDVGSLVAQIAAAARLVDAVIAAPETSGSEVRSSRVSRGPLVDDRTVVLTALLVLLIALMALIETSDPVLSEHLNNVLSLPVGIVLAVAASDWQRRRG